MLAAKYKVGILFSLFAESFVIKLESDILLFKFGQWFAVESNL